MPFSIEDARAIALEVHAQQVDEIGREVSIDELRGRGVPERALAAIAAVSSNLHPDHLTYLGKIERILRRVNPSLLAELD